MEPTSSGMRPDGSSLARTPLLAFLMTDVEGSTRLWETQREAMSWRMRAHDRIVRDAVASNEGRIFKSLGDGFCAVFPSASDALAAAAEIHRELVAAEGADQLGVRMAVHCGTAEERDGDYFGPAINRVTRLLSLGAPGELVLSRAAYSLLEDELPRSARVRSLGRRRLRGLVRQEEPHVVMLDTVSPGEAEDSRPAISIWRRKMPWWALALTLVGLAAAVILVFVIAGASKGKAPTTTPTSGAGANWSQDGHDGSHSGTNPLEKAISVSNVGRLHIAWSTHLPSVAAPREWSALTVVNGRVYAGSSAGTWAFALDSGNVIWHTLSTGDTSASEPSIVGSRVYLGSAAGDLFALSAENGTPIWKVSTQSGARHAAPLTSPIVTGGLIFVGSEGGSVWAYRDRTTHPALQWTANQGTFTTSPAVVGGDVFLGSNDGVQTLRAVSGSGDPAWGAGFSRPSVTFTAPSVEGDTLLVAGVDRSGPKKRGLLYGLNRQDGRQRWIFPPSTAVPSVPLAQPAVGGGFVYVVSSRGTVSRLDETTGLRSWTVHLVRGGAGIRAFWWRPTLAGGVLYVAGVGPRGAMIVALDAAGGQVLWQHLFAGAGRPMGISAAEPTVVGRWVLVSISFTRPSGASAVKPGIYVFREPTR